MSDETELPTLPFWQARSWWMTFYAVLAPVVSMLGLDWPWVSDPETVNTTLQVTSAIAAGLAWRERLNPKKRLTAR